MEEAGAGGRAGIFEERALEGMLENAFGERALESALEARSWLEPVEMKEIGKGAVRSPVHRGEMVGWALGLEWIWRDHPQGRQ